MPENSYLQQIENIKIFFQLFKYFLLFNYRQRVHQNQPPWPESFPFLKTDFKEPFTQLSMDVFHFEDGLLFA